ncbi:MAG TPA: LacI family DNA-binding transcriptional regulator [Bacteroidales bacterium]|nr:LacI family DNA-binding transcriptional regulator [Bacteroidales bacterium]
MGRRVKSKDLAARLGVSGTLVSLVLNNKADQHGIRKDTQERVLALARQMGYFDLLKERNEISPIEEKPGVLGMIVPSLHDPFIYEITPYLQKAFSSIGVGFSIMTKDPDDQRYNRLVGAFKKFYTGLILVGEAADDYTIRSLRASNYPFVLLEKSVKILRLNTVCTNNSEGSVRVVDHIAKLGYRNVIIVTDRKPSPGDTSVIEDLKIALGRKDGINKPLIAELDTPVSGYEPDFGLFERFLRPPFSAEIIIVLHAEMVYPVMTLLRKKKLRVPQDIALISMEEGIGFDLMYSPVTCLRKPLPGMALKVANMIWSEVKNSGKSKYKRQVNISPELIIRNSCGTI